MIRSRRSGAWIVVMVLAFAGCGRGAPPPVPVVDEQVHQLDPPDSGKSDKDSTPRPPGKGGARVVVVAPLHVRTGDDKDTTLGESLGEILAVALADQKHVVVVDRQKLKDVLAEQKLGASGLVAPATAARVGQLLSADFVVAGSIVDVEGKLRYAINVIAVDGRRVLGGVQHDGSRKDFDRAALEIAGKLAPIVGVKLPAIKPEELDDSPVGRLHLMRGIGYFHANNPDQAIVYCLQAVRLDPRLQEARLWIARAYLQQGEKEHARAEIRLLQRNPAAKPLTPQLEKLLQECGPEPAEPKPPTTG